MTKLRQPRSASFKFKVALEAIQGDKTINQIASEYQLNPGQVSQWKRHLQSEGSRLFERDQKGTERQQAKKEAALYEQIGRLNMELTWLKKKFSSAG